MNGSWLSHLGVDAHSERTIAIWCTLFGLGGVILLFMDKWTFDHAVVLWMLCSVVASGYYWMYRHVVDVDEDLLKMPEKK